MASFPPKVVHLICEMASKGGWDGCHWDNPLIVDIDSSEKDEYEKRFRPPHTW